MKSYIVPEVKEIVIDNEISLTLDSNAPEGPNESFDIPHIIKPFNITIAR